MSDALAERLDALWRDVDRPLRAFLRRSWGLDDADLDDAVAGAFTATLAAWRRSGRDPAGLERSYLFAAAYTQAAKLKRRDQRHPATSLDGPLPRSAAVAGTRAGPDEVAEHRELLRAVRVAVEQLPPGDRDVFAARVECGDDLAAVADRTGRSRRAVRKATGRVNVALDGLGGV